MGCFMKEFLGFGTCLYQKPTAPPATDKYENPWTADSENGKCQSSEQVQTVKVANDSDYKNAKKGMIFAGCTPKVAQDTICPGAPKDVKANPVKIDGSCRLVCVSDDDCATAATCLTHNAKNSSFALQQTQNNFCLYQKPDSM